MTRRVAMTCVRTFFIAAWITGGLGLMMTQECNAVSLQVLGSALPEVINGWRAEPPDRFFDGKTIFDYIDGAGEVYRAYNMHGCLSRRYTTPNGPSIVLDIFDMGSSEDAYGVFTHDQEGESLGVGQEALYKAGWLRFWKDRFFVSLYGEDQTPALTKASIDLGKAVAELITTEGQKPRILSRLPSQGLLNGSIRYLHDHIVLNSHFYLADENILLLGPQVEAVFARYQRGDRQAGLLLVSYPHVEKAIEALKGLLKHYLPDADKEGIARLEDGKWASARREGILAAVVLEADSKDLAGSLVREALKSIPGDD
jgi:hypothetical protein